MRILGNEQPAIIMIKIPKIKYDSDMHLSLDFVRYILESVFRYGFTTRDFRSEVPFLRVYGF
jgi:hypothetical protein